MEPVSGPALGEKKRQNGAKAQSHQLLERGAASACFSQEHLLNLSTLKEHSASSLRSSVSLSFRVRHSSQVKT
jgi:hypothetical protein